MASKKVTKKTSKKTTKTVTKKSIPRNQDIDWILLDKILQFKMTLKDCEDILEVSHDTIERRIRKKFDLTFSEYRQRKMSKTKLRLQQKAIQMAMEGNVVMMIFSLKNICKWTDTPEPDQDENYELDFIQ